MPKHGSTEALQLPGVSCATFWEIIFSDIQATVDYHVRCNSSVDTHVGAWRSDEREVTFTTTVPLLPNILRDQIKYWYPSFDWDRVPVREVQRVTWRGERGASSFAVSSKPEVAESSVGSIVATDLELLVTELPPPPPEAEAEAVADAADANSGHATSAAAAAAAACGPCVEVSYRVTCTANAKTWVGSCVPGIEDASVSRALESMNAFLAFCKERLATTAA